MIVIRKSYTLEMAHQLYTCVTDACRETIHGHSYTVGVYLRVPHGQGLDMHGMVCDFGGLSSVKRVLMEFDHALVMPSAFEQEYLDALDKNNTKLIITPFNPTAENIARYMLAKLLDDAEVRSAIAHHAEIFKLRLHETATGYAEVSVS